MTPWLIQYGPGGLALFIVFMISVMAKKQIDSHEKECNERKVVRAAENASVVSSLATLSNKVGELAGVVTSVASEERAARSILHSQVNKNERDIALAGRDIETLRRRFEN